MKIKILLFKPMDLHQYFNENKNTFKTNKINNTFYSNQFLH